MISSFFRGNDNGISVYDHRPCRDEGLEPVLQRRLAAGDRLSRRRRRRKILSTNSLRDRLGDSPSRTIAITFVARPDPGHPVSGISEPAHGYDPDKAYTVEVVQGPITTGLVDARVYWKTPDKMGSLKKAATPQHAIATIGTWSTRYAATSKISFQKISRRDICAAAKTSPRIPAQ